MGGWPQVILEAISAIKLFFVKRKRGKVEKEKAAIRNDAIDFYNRRMRDDQPDSADENAGDDVQRGSS